MSEKCEYGLNIYILSKKSDDIIKKIKEVCKSDNKEQNITYFWNWEQLKECTLEDKLNKMIDLLKDKIESCSNSDNNQSFKEVLIIQSNKISKILLESLDDIIGENGQYYHPFIIFLTEEKISVNYEEYKNLDDKKIFFLDFKEDETSISILIFKLIQCCSYYNELGDYFEINGYPYQSISDVGEDSTYLNILILGRSQTGKSTFINLLLGEKRAKEGGNNCGCSQKCQKYKVINYPIRLYDTVGFGDEDKNVEDIKKFFKKMDDELTNAKEKIHLILYFVNYKEGNKFAEKELMLIKEIRNRKILTFFIVTRFERNPEENKEKYENQLNQIKNSLISKIGQDFEKENDLYKFIGVNLVKEDEDEQFGFQTIIDQIYTYFKKESKDLAEIKEMYDKRDKKEKINWEELFPKIKKNFFFNHLINYESTVKKYEDEARHAIRKAKIKAGTLGMFPIIDIISHYFVKNSLKNDIEKSFNLNKKEEKEEKEKNEEQKKLEDKIDQKVESSFTNFVRQGLGVVSGVSGDIIAENAAKSVGQYGLRIAGGWALMGVQIIIGPIVGIFKMSNNGEEMIKIYKEKFEEENYDVTLALIESILKGIEFFKMKSSK